MSPLRIGLVGGGVVGGGVYELLSKISDQIVVVTALAVRDVNKPRDFSIASSTHVTDNPLSLSNDPNIDCIVEVMGGTGLAADVVKTALENGKSVVTANKALLASQMGVLEHSKNLAFEAAVCGGIPIIHTLQTALAGDSVQSIRAIANGTTNYMLSQMEDNGADYFDVLKEAQELGYAEADPTADVDGLDVQAKLCILTKLAFGVTAQEIPTTGIRQITALDFKAAANFYNSTIKLLGTAQRRSNDEVSVYVSPCMVNRSSFPILASAKGPGNVVAMESQNLGWSHYTGPGAGRYPTANSVVADILRIAAGSNNKEPFPPVLGSENLSITSEFTAPFYVRCQSSLASIVAAATSTGIVVESMQTLDGAICLTVAECTITAIREFVKQLGNGTCLPILK